jgi:hypothetical protein
MMLTRVMRNDSYKQVSIDESREQKSDKGHYSVVIYHKIAPGMNWQFWCRLHGS